MCALCFRKYWFSVKYPKMRFYVRFSFWGFLIESIIVLAWFITYLCVYPHAGNGFQSFSVIHTKISLFE
ncbi:uncharacterized protein MONOS_18642 [Monocercomonoides exilis]|uniref:uncharacterized protein n=1 Tax=Monocercomonoides exilis TaxID=2049356 RepID=UPI00355967F3|nr:hypothetical protein MONOS_18642 [Monocercomonoides exilis]